MPSASSFWATGSASLRITAQRGCSTPWNTGAAAAWPSALATSCSMKARLNTNGMSTAAMKTSGSLAQASAASMPASGVRLGERSSMASQSGPAGEFLPSGLASASSSAMGVSPSIRARARSSRGPRSVSRCTMAMGSITFAASRTARVSSRSPRNFTRAFFLPMRELSPPQRIAAQRPGMRMT